MVVKYITRKNMYISKYNSLQVSTKYLIEAFTSNFLGN